MKDKKRYFTVFSFIYYGRIDDPVVKTKHVATGVTSAQAKYLAGLLNKSLPWVKA